jgi:hypothetical protein
MSVHSSLGIYSTSTSTSTYTAYSTVSTATSSGYSCVLIPEQVRSRRDAEGRVHLTAVGHAHTQGLAHALDVPGLQRGDLEGARGGVHVNEGALALLLEPIRETLMVLS